MNGRLAAFEVRQQIVEAPALGAELVPVGFELLTDVIGRLGDEGRLRMSVERATSYFRSCGAGYILIQIATQPHKRDRELSSIMFYDMMAAISTDPKRKRSATPELPGRAWRCEKRCATRRLCRLAKPNAGCWLSGSTDWPTAASSTP